MWGFMNLFSICCILIHLKVVYTTVSEQIAGQLPHCTDNKNGFILISTLDGKLTSLGSSGSVLWSLDTGPGPLLTSNIHNVELSNNGEWIRMIPALSGNLYKFNGKTVDAIAISADSLLKSSFVYSNDLIIAGGKEVRTYGVLSKTGQHMYTCMLLEGCHNETTGLRDELEEDAVDDDDIVIVIERSTSVVRAHEPRTGIERWNFSVGHHNINIPHTSCSVLDPEIVKLKLTAVIPDGVLVATDNVKLWEHKLDSPIVQVWTWNGRDLNTVDLLKPETVKSEGRAEIYLGMHKKQLYIQERLSVGGGGKAIQHQHMRSIPWKPVVASKQAVVAGAYPGQEQQTTALSVLYGSEYVNGNGFYLYAAEAPPPDTCSQNRSSNPQMGTAEGAPIVYTLFFYWKEILVISMSTALAFNFLNQRFISYFRKSKLILPYTAKTADDDSVTIVQRTVDHRRSANVVINVLINAVINVNPPPLPQEVKPLTDSPPSGAAAAARPEASSFSSRYMEDFEMVQCLGKGGYGIVFQVKQKIDECAYAIKRITLPKEEKSRERVMREAKALAQLEHHNIVRYYNSWLEAPPVGWSDEFDRLHGEDDDDDEYSTSSTVCSQTNQSTNCNSSDGGAKASCADMYLYIQMELCMEKSLRDWLMESSETAHETRRREIYTQILRAVIYVHGRGLIHRDLKPSNVFFSNKDGSVKVGDFGLATSCYLSHDGASAATPPIDGLVPLGGARTRDAGTTLYMSPEQLNGHTQYDNKVDIFALGVILFELVVPFGTEMERYLCLQDLRDGQYPVDFTNRHPSEYKLLQRMLSESPEQRPSATELISIYNQQ